MIEFAQVYAVMFGAFCLVALAFDMSMNGARYASGLWVVLMGIAGSLWLVAEWVR